MEFLNSLPRNNLHACWVFIEELIKRNHECIDIPLIFKTIIIILVILVIQEPFTINSTNAS